MNVIRVAHIFFRGLVLVGMVNSAKAADMQTARHVSIVAETLVPTTEGGVWLSNCNPIDARNLEALFEDFSNAKLPRTTSERFSPMHVRVVMNSLMVSYIIDGQFIVKRVDQETVSYFVVERESALYGRIEKNFSTCLQ